MAADPGRIHAALTAAGHAMVTGVGPDVDGVTMRLTFDPSVTQNQRDAANAYLATLIADAYFSGARARRTLYAIRADVLLLSVAQKAAAWNALTAGSPPPWATDAGPNAAALAALQMFGTSVTLSAADMLEAKIRAAAMYAQDNPRWLIHPAFDASINIPGDQPA